jgi:SulP family sulfate permease
MALTRILDKLKFRPRLADTLKGYDAATFSTDLGAGMTVGLVALPLAMAFAIASGVSPESGIFTAIIGGFLVSALGGSRVQIGGPAGAFIVIIYGIIQQYGLANLLIATAMAGVLLVVMGATGVGSLIRFIPIAIVIGFTNGIAVLIALSQVRDFFGLDTGAMPANFFSQVSVIAKSASTVNFWALGVALVSLSIVALWPRLAALTGRLGMSGLPGRAALVGRVPGTVVALALATAATAFLGLPVETIGSRFGGIPQGLPAFALPAFDWDSARNLVAPTITIALLGAIESLLCARVADGMTNDRHDPNQELIAQGIANIASPLFGGIPVTGTIARTTTNIRAGAKTPVAGIVHALTLLAIILVAAPLATHVPLASLAAILVFVAWNMGDWAAFRRLVQYSFNYRAIMLSTFLLTVAFDLTVAVEVGMVLASLFFIYRISELTRIEPVDLGGAHPRVAAYKLFGSLFFGAVGKLEALLDEERSQVDVVVLELHQVINLDTTGLDTIEVLHRVLREEGRHLVLAGANAQPMSLLRRSGFLTLLGEANLQPDLPAALERARGLAGPTTTAP